MTTFDERERGYENRFARDEEFRFKTVARRNRLFGQWAAAELGKTGEAADAYTKEVVRADFTAPGDDDVLQKVAADFAAAGRPEGEKELRAKMTALLMVAAEQLS